MSAYRDSFENCPRCGVALVDARAARGCEQCGGLWVEEPVLSEMVLTMLPPQPHGRLLLAVLQRAGEKLPCPTCGDAMHPTEIHGVELDRCPKHGIWFDKPELEEALRRVADPALPPPLADAVADVVIEPARRTVAPRTAPKQVTLRFKIESPGGPMREIDVTSKVIKLGSLPTANVSLTDPRVSRMHAIIEVDGPDDVVLIDLASREGTSVNGKRINKARLHSGDQILMGATLVTVEIGQPAAPVLNGQMLTTFIVVAPGQNVQEVKLDVPVIKIGTNRSAHLRLDDPQVSRLHALIEVKSLSEITVLDLGSREGTFVNGKRVTKARLHNNDVMQFGATLVTILFGV
jgi:pSer/pThr/pTyr-binding forkhead associated (FHA) protein/Zn-finger nucleic acid-binding protein